MEPSETAVAIVSRSGSVRKLVWLKGLVKVIAVFEWIYSGFMLIVGCLQPLISSTYAKSRDLSRFFSVVTFLILASTLSSLAKHELLFSRDEHQLALSERDNAKWIMKRNIAALVFTLAACLIQFKIFPMYTPDITNDFSIGVVVFLLMSVVVRVITCFIFKLILRYCTDIHESGSDAADFTLPQDSNPPTYLFDFPPTYEDLFGKVVSTKVGAGSGEIPGETSTTVVADQQTAATGAAESSSTYKIPDDIALQVNYKL